MPQGGEIMELSGIGQEGAPPQGGAPSWIWYGISAGVGILLGYLYHRYVAPHAGSVLEGLGIIEPCRTEDRIPGRPASDQEWCLWDSKKKRILGRHPSRTKALRQERAVQARKHR